jgi:hypothetical protein
MSLRLRLAVLVLFLAVFGANPVPVQAECDYSCTTLYWAPPYWVIECPGLHCVFADECETNCTIRDCQENEAGAVVTLECFL